MNVVVLAAGMGKRMNSDLPKVLHPIAGRPMLAHVIAAARTLPDARITIVIGHGGDQVREHFASSGDLQWVVQQPQLGTGHAVQQAAPNLDESRPTLILYGDVPLTRPETLASLSDVARDGSTDPVGALAVLTVTMDDPRGYGRIVRSDDLASVRAIVEEKDATDAQREIREINTGIMIAPTRALKDWLSRLSNRNAQGEYYLTDIVGLANADGVRVVATQPMHAWETTGVNSKGQLAALERQAQRNEAERLLDGGVRLADPDRIDVRGSLACGRDVFIDVGCVFLGDVLVGDNAWIGPYAVIRNTVIGDNVRIDAFTHVDGGLDAAGSISIGSDAVVGPYARLRPGTQLGSDVHIGNFVEVKNSTVAHGSKANHLSYLGDATIGADVNVGAGTITCNYDGASKHRTVIEDDVHIGSDVQLVAPVTIGKAATVGAGTTVWKDVTPGVLAINERTQVEKSGWQRPVKRKKPG